MKMNISNQFLRIVIFMMVLCSAVDGYSQANEYKNEEEEDPCIVYPEVCDEDREQLDEIGITVKGNGGGDGDDEDTDDDDGGGGYGDICLYYPSLCTSLGGGELGENSSSGDGSGDEEDGGYDGDLGSQRKDDKSRKDGYWEYYILDNDRDGYGNQESVVYADVAPEGHITMEALRGLDCDDSGGDSKYATTGDSCNKVDWYLDADKDKYHKKNATKTAFYPLAPKEAQGYVKVSDSKGEDCDDGNYNVTTQCNCQAPTSIANLPEALSTSIAGASSVNCQCANPFLVNNGTPNPDTLCATAVFPATSTFYIDEDKDGYRNEAFLCSNCTAQDTYYLVGTTLYFQHQGAQFANQNRKGDGIFFDNIGLGEDRCRHESPSDSNKPRDKSGCIIVDPPPSCDCDKLTTERNNLLNKIRFNPDTTVDSNTKLPKVCAKIEDYLAKAYEAAECCGTDEDDIRDKKNLSDGIAENERTENNCNTEE